MTRVLLHMAAMAEHVQILGSLIPFIAVSVMDVESSLRLTTSLT
jgi:hypothetical protein